MLRDPIIQNLYPQIFEFEEAIDVISVLKEWPKTRLCDDKAIARKTKIDIKTVTNILKLLETNNFVYNLKVNEVCIKLIKHFRSGKLSHKEIAKKLKLDVEIVDQYIEENESLLLETKKTYSQQTLKTLNDNFNALIKGEKKDKEDKDKEDAAVSEEQEKIAKELEEIKEAKSDDDDKKVLNLAKESDDAVIKEEVDEDKDKKAKAKKPKAKKEKTAKKRAVNMKFWYLTFDEIIACLKDGYTTDEEISEKISCKLNIVRKILYKLYDMRLASYKRDKDKETQWYTYDWRFNEGEYKKLEFNLASSELKRLNSELEYEENNMFFVCPNGHYRLDFEDASTVEFLCPECDLDLEFEDNQERIDRKKAEIKVLEDLISE
ncbi:transcription factor E [Methanobrevibacter sp.]|uniref:transcription factor E n=1 Tax=Methanobrevibacter sp. TaxID=66852 RepID=UPI003890DF86